MVSVAFDTSACNPEFKAHSQRGIGRYVRELTSALRAFEGPEFQFSEFDQKILTSNGISSKFIDLLPCFKQTARQQLLYPQKLAQLKVDLVHFPAHLDAPAWAPVPFAVTVLDLIPLIFKDLYKASKTNLRFTFGRWLENNAIKNAKLIFAISKSTANDVHNILGIPLEKIVVTHLGVGPEYLALKEKRKKTENSKVKNLLYVGGIDQRKNISTLLKAFRGLLDKNLSFDSKLILVGGIKNDDQYPKLLQEIDSLKLGEHIHETGFVSEPELHILYTQADLFVFPSLYEGFGFPVLEAMAAGVPVIASNTSSIPEVLGETGVLIDPKDINGFTEAMEALLKDDNRARDHSEVGHLRAKQFTWEKTARNTLNGYKGFAD